MSICILGDIHFRDDHSYFSKASEDFLRWFQNWGRNTKENTLILAGDLVESSLLSGNVAEYLERLAKYSNFNSIHICVGNHDKRKYHNDDQLAYEFYKNKVNIHIYEKPTEVDIEGKKVLFLPYFVGLNCLGKTMREYYGEIYNNKNFSNDYDLVVGHFCGEDASYFGGSDCVPNLDKINTKKLVLGHIHTRGMNPSVYIGSVFACKKNENDNTRSALVLDGDEWIEERLPVFTEFLTVTYPYPLPQTNALTPIYTILNCKSEAIALSKYPNIFIKRTTTEMFEISGGSRSNVSEQDFDAVKKFDTKELFSAFLKANEFNFDEEVKSDCKRLLGIEE